MCASRPRYSQTDTVVGSGSAVRRALSDLCLKEPNSQPALAQPTANINLTAVLRIDTLYVLDGLAHRDYLSGCLWFTSHVLTVLYELLASYYNAPAVASPSVATQSQDATKRRSEAKR